MTKIIKLYCIIALIISFWLWYYTKSIPHISIIFAGGVYVLKAIEEFLNKNNGDGILYIAFSLVFMIFGTGMVIHY